MVWMMRSLGATPIEVSEGRGHVGYQPDSFRGWLRRAPLDGRVVTRWRSVVTRLTALPSPLARVSLARLTRRSTVKSVSLIAETSLAIHQRSASLPKSSASSVGDSPPTDDLESLAP